MENTNLRSRIPFALNFAAFIIIIAGFMYAQTIVTQIILALFISIICAQPIMWLQKKKLPLSLSIIIVLIMIGGVFIGFGSLISSSFSSFSENAPLYEENLTKMGSSVINFLNEKGLSISETQVTNIFEPAKVMSITAGFLSQLGGIMGNTFTIFFLTLFLLLELNGISIKAKVLLLDSKSSFSYLGSIISSIRNYLSIKTLTSLITGICIWIALAIIGVDYAIIWALIAFLLNYIPNIGSIIAAVPAVLFALVQLGFSGVIWTVSVFVAVNMIVGNLIEPKMMGKGMGLSTYVVFVSLIFWGFVLGIVGMFLSVPLTISIKIILEQKESTKWMAILLGTQEEAQLKLDNHNLSNKK